MKPIVVRDQIRLGPMRALDLCLRGMSYRMFRSLVTMAILALAVAFLIHVLSHSLIGHETRWNAYQELRGSRMLGQWVRRLSRPDPQPAMLTALADGHKDRLAEYQRWSGVNAATIERMQETAKAGAEFVAYMEDRPPAVKASVLGDQRPYGLLGNLEDSERLAEFRRKMNDFQQSPPADGWEWLHALAQERWPALREFIEQAQQAQREAIAQARAAFEQSPQALLAEAPDGLLNALTNAGFEVTAEQLSELQGQARLAVDMQRLDSLLGSAEVEAAVAREMGVTRNEVNLPAVLMWLNGESDWLADVLAEKEPGAFSAERLSTLGETYRRQQRLQDTVGSETPQARSGLLELPTRLQWLIAVSLLVCIVGVANAMFMSVTERFAEIATMKCLGAMDGSIMVLFLFEASIQGFVGGLIGLVIGIVLAFGRGILEFGTLIFGVLPVGDILYGSLLALAAGMVLAVLAAIAPAWAAARLAPMEAMRVE